MADLEQLYDALRKADAAGNTDDAAKLAGFIRQQSVAKPAEKAAPEQKAPEDVGFVEGATAALKRGVSSLGDVASGLGLAGTATLGSKENTAAKMAAIKADQEKQQREETKPAMTVEDFQRIAADKGFAAAAAQAPKYIVEQVLQSAPQMAGPLAVGAAVSPFLTPIGGAIAGIATYGVQQFGNFLVRQAQEKNSPEELEVTKAALTAAGTAPLGYFADRFTLGIGSVGKTAGKEILKELAAREGAGAVAKEVGKRALVGATEGVITEAPTEVLEQAAERYQAGLSLTDEKALGEYKEAFFGAAAAGGALGAGSKGAQAYGDYRKEKKALAGEAGVDKRRSAIDEANEYDDNGRPIAGTGESSVSVPSEPGAGSTTGTDESTAPSMAATKPATGGLDAGETPLDNQLNTATKSELDTKITELNKKINEAAVYVRDLADTNPNDERIAYAQEHLSKLYNEVYSLEAARKELPKATSLNAPSQQGFDFTEPDENTKRTLDTTPTEFGLTAENTSAPAAKEPIEPIVEPDRAKMMLIGDAKAPMKPLQAFFNSLKPSTVMPAEVTKFKEETRKLLDDVAEFIGGKITKQVSRFEGTEKGPDVSAELSGPELDARLGYVRDFFDSLSIAPKEREALTSALSQRFAGMSMPEQTAALQGLTSVPKLNTRRGIEELRTKLSQALDNYERKRIGQEETALPFKLTDALAKMDPYIIARIAKALKDLNNIDPSQRTPEEKAAYAYFGPDTGWSYTTAMRSAAFDISSKVDEFAGKLFKGQDKTQAELFQKWVEENLPQQEYRRFEATVADYKRQILKAEDYRKTAEKLKKEGGVARKYFQSVARAPSGKVSTASIAWGRGPGKASEVTKLDPSKFYPMHPAVQKMLEDGDVNGALKILAKQDTRGQRKYTRFTAHLAQKLLDMNLNTTVLINQQGRLVDSLITRNVGEQRSQFYSYMQENHPAIFDEYFSKSDPRQVLKGLEAIQSGEVKVKTDPILGQFEEMLDEYQRGVATLDSSGSYLPYLNTVNLNFDMGGGSNYTFLHEMMHAATAYSLNPDNFDKLTPAEQKAVTELTALYEFARRTTLKEYGFTNIDEFVAEAFSNEKFQQLLNSIPYKGGTEQFLEAEQMAVRDNDFAEAYNRAKKEGRSSIKWKGVEYQTGFALKSNKTLWDKFTEFVSKLFGMDNVLGYTLANANVIMQAPSPLTGEAVALNNRGQGRRSVLNGTMPTNPGFIKFLDRTFGGRPQWHTLKYNMSHLIDSVQDSTRKYYLGGFTLRQLNDMIGSRVPQFRKFIEKYELMVDERNRLIDRSRQIGRRFLDYQKNNPEKYQILSELMIDVTRDDRSAQKFNKDPAKGPTGLTHVDDAWNKLDDEGKAVYKQVRDFYMETRREYVEITLDDVRQSLLNQGYSKADIDAQKDINAKFGIPIKAMQAKGKAQGLSSDVIENSLTTFLKGKGYTDTEIEAYIAIQGVKDYFAEHEVDVYFPLYRRGEFSLQLGRKDTDREYYLFETAGERNFFQQQRIAELAKKNIKLDPDDIIPRNSKEQLMNSGLQDFEFFDKLKKMIDTGKGSNAADLKKNLLDNIEQMQFLLLPDGNLRKRFMHRKGIAGMETDMADAFTNSSFHLSYQLARKKYSRDLYNLTETAANDIKAKGEEGKVEHDYLQELNKRLNNIMNPVDTGGLPTLLSNVSFLWYLTAPASAIVNILGVPAVSLPVMAARFGGAASTAKVAEYAKTFFKAGYRDANGKVTFPSINNDLDLLKDTRGGATAAIKKRAYQQLGIDGLFDITLHHSLVDLAEKPNNAASSATEKVMQVASAMFHGAEKFNREIVGMATFDLAFTKAKEKGFSDDAAFKQAIKITKDLTYKSMGDYATANKPRIFQHPALKVILQFKLFSQNMTYMLGRSVLEATHREYSEVEREAMATLINNDLINDGKAALTGKAKEDAVNAHIKDIQKEAFKRLGGTLGMTAIFAGASGLPLWSVVSMTMNALHAVFGDDDDEEYDFDNWFKNWCNNTFGGFVGDSISRGVVSQVAGADVASRLSLNDMWYRDARKSPDQVTAVQNMLIQLLGPTASLGVTAFGQIPQLVNEGHIDRAMEAALPAAFKGAMKSYRLANEGAKTLSGNTLIEDVSGAEIFSQALGFSPERLAQRQKANIEMKTAEQNIMNRRQSLLDAFFMSIDSSDDDLKERVIDKIGKFNQSHPGVAISANNAMNSVKTRYKLRALADSTGGMPINKKLIGELQHMADWGNPD